jgi:hypothetical protein
MRLLAFRGRVVARDRLQDDLLRFLGAAPAVELHPLALLEILVVLEEVADALQPVLADLVDVGDVRVAGEHLEARDQCVSRFRLRQCDHVPRRTDPP